MAYKCETVKKEIVQSLSSYNVNVQVQLIYCLLLWMKHCVLETCLERAGSNCFGHLSTTRFTSRCFLTGS
jgi:hypothetical protein